jgi:hypothetical protein
MKVDWESVADVLRGVAPETYATSVKKFTEEKPGARVFRVFGKESE